MDLAEKFRLFVYLFDRRPDIEVSSFEVIEQEGLTAKEAAPFKDKLPEDFSSFLKTFDGLEFSYRITSLEDHQGSGSGGSITLERLGDSGRQWWAHHGFEPLEFENYMMLEDVNGEWTAKYVQMEGQEKKDATISFFSSGDDYYKTWSSFEEYLQDGARNAFVWMWQQADVYWECAVLLGALLRASVDPSTPREELRERLFAQFEKIHPAIRRDVPLELTAEKADELIDWLGDRVVLLLPRD